MNKKALSLMLTATMVGTLGTFGVSADEAEDKSNITVTIWECNNGDEGYEGALQKLAERASEATGYNVEATMISWDGYHETFMSAAMAGTAPDIACEASTAPFEYHSMGMTLDLTPIYDQWIEEGSDFVNQIPQKVWDFETDEDGVLYALPYGVDGAGFFYNKAVFEEAGIEELPTNWDELTEVCEKIYATGKIPLVVAANIAKNQTTAAQMFLNMNNTSNLHEDFTAGVLDDATQEAYQYVYDLYEAGYIGKCVVEYSMEDCQRLLLDGEAGMFIGKSPIWCPEDEQDKIGIMRPMVGPSAEGIQTGCSYQAYYCFNQSGHDDATREVMKWWIENNDILWTEGHSTRIPIRNEQLEACIDSPLVIEFAQNWPLGENGVTSIWPLTRMQPFTSQLDAQATDGIVPTAIFSGEDWHEASEYAQQVITDIIESSME